jgi:chemotaxis methyl-accepting protein methylase
MDKWRHWPDAMQFIESEIIQLPMAKPCGQSASNKLLRICGDGLPHPVGSAAGHSAPEPVKRTSRTKRQPAIKSVRSERLEKADSSANVSFPIVGIGASAGGLEALEQFLRRVLSDSGMAFVIVQHLDPTREGIMPELLQRTTRMTVKQVKDCTMVEPNSVYVIPPNKDMSILHGVLHLLEPAAPRGLRLPIDFFLRSLAQDQQERSIGVILSGMGSDGTLGLRAIKEKAGLVLVQEPTSAKFDAMPRSAIEAGLADIIAPVDELPGKIVEYLGRKPLLPPTVVELPGKTQDTIEKVVILLRAHSGHDFSRYKRNILYRRVERRMAIHQLHEMTAYLRYLRENSQELDLLFKELLIGVTNFFRDPDAWEQLRTTALPSLLARRMRGSVLRAWIPGCSTGEEAYSLAMVFREVVEQSEHPGEFALQIFATDLDRDAIDKARQGFYPANSAADLKPEQVKRFFTKDDGGYRVRKEIREMVIFAPQNLIMDPPFTRLDILCCRNLLIYLTQEAQQKLIPLFHYSLNPGGLLFLGSAETIGADATFFTTECGNARIFRRVDSAIRHPLIELPSSFRSRPVDATTPGPAPKSPLTLQAAADQWVLQHHALPTVLTNDKGDICYISGRTGRYLEPAAGKANWNLFAMAREGLRYELADAFQKALRLRHCVSIHALKIEAQAGAGHVDVIVQQIEEPSPLQGLVLIVFKEVPAPVATPPEVSPLPRHDRGARVQALQQELLRTREEARHTREEMQTSQEELRSANEELQSTNEELQSTNEELTTSKEEMQSLNEELQTVNAELQSKVDELSRTSNDMKNLLDSTDIATLFLDRALRVRRFTPQTTRIIKLISSDIGRPITDLVSNLNYPDLTGDVRQVLDTLVSTEKVVTASSSRWFCVRIMPYRTLDDRIDGVVITFADISAAKALEVKLRTTQAALELRVADQTVELGRRREGSEIHPGAPTAIGEER